MFKNLMTTRLLVNFKPDNPGFLELIKRSLVNWFKWIILVSFLFFTMIMRVAFIPSSSMTPTVQTNEIVCSGSLSFGWTPINFSPIFKNWNIPILSIKPQCGEPIAFYDKHNYNMVFCKRIIGCPGDRVRVSNGFVIINGKPLQLKYVGYYTFMYNEQFKSGDIFEETMPNGLTHKVLQYEGFGYNFQDNTPEFIVPEGYYFCMGDNRNDSLDSRCELGFVQEKHMLGKVYMILISNGNLFTLNLWKFMNSLRLDRCFTWFN